MAKITQLPPAGPLDGSEVMPVVQDGETKGINPAVHLAYIALGAELARDQAADLVLPQNIFVDVALGVAEAAVPVDTVFKLVDSGTGLAQVRRRNGGGSAHLYSEATTAALISPAGAAMLGTADGSTVQAMLDSSLQAHKHFNSVVAVAPGELAGWVLTTTSTPGQPRDGILIYHEMDDPSNGLHVLATANPGCTGGQAGGFAMDGSGIGSALQCNRRGDGFGNGANGNVVDEVTGFGLSGQFSSTAIGGGVEAIKQNSGVTGTAGIGPALQVANSSDEGHAIDSATALNNLTDTSHRFTRLQREGINADFRMNADGARGGPLSVVRAVLAPGAASTGAGGVNAFEAIIGANITGSDKVCGLLAVNDSAGNEVAIGVHGLARGDNITNYGGRFEASGADNNIAVRVDGQSWLLGNIQGALPEYANDAAASATLQLNYWYINSATGAVTARRA